MKFSILRYNEVRQWLWINIVQLLLLLLLCSFCHQIHIVDQRSRVADEIRLAIERVFGFMMLSI